VAQAGSAPGRPAAGADTGGWSGLPVSAVALSAAFGVLVVAAADTAGRLGHSGSAWPVRAYWLGQALILVPAAARLLSRRVRSSAATLTVIVVLTVAEYLVKVCYSPAAFTFPDELQHWRSTVDILQTGTLSSPNYLLPISPHYPGLEEVTSALAATTGLGVFPSGLIVIGTAHLLFVCLLYALFHHVAGSPRLAGVAVAFYVGNSHFQSFDSMFAYQTLALTFFALALLAVWRLATADPAGWSRGWLTIAVLAILATAMTHHVTSFLLVAVLVVIAVACLLTGHRRSARWPATLALFSAVTVALWVLFAAPGTVSYLGPVAAGVVRGFGALLTGGHSSAQPVSAGPLGNRLLAAAALLAVSMLLPVGWWRVWRARRRDPWIMALALGSIGWYAVIAVRLAAPNGSELAGRASTFVFVPVAFIAAVAVLYLLSLGVRWQARTMAVAALIAVTMLMFDGLANGWPPYWARLPGPYQVAAYERSVEPEDTAAARWSLTALGPGNRFAADFGSYSILGSYGYQNPVRDVGYLYTSPVFGPAQASGVQAQSIRYLLVDRRLSQMPPVTGQYFPDDNGRAYTHPIPPADLAKFNHVPGVSRRYDSGNIVIYQFGGPRRAS
jgi:hypothetical protein